MLQCTGVKKKYKMKTLTKKPKKTTHIAQVRADNRQGMHQVCHLLQCTEQDYCDYLFAQYCKFIEVRYKHYPDVIANHILYSKLFRGMFNNAAAKRDEDEFLPFATDATTDGMMVNDLGELVELWAVDLGCSDLIEQWMGTHSYKRLLDDQQFINQFDHVVKLISIL